MCAFTSSPFHSVFFCDGLDSSVVLPILHLAFYPVLLGILRDFTRHLLNKSLDDVPSHFFYLPLPFLVFRITLGTPIILYHSPTDHVCPGCSGWAAVWDETHRAFYYHNLVTDETSWVLPVSDPAPPAALPGESSPTKSVTFSPAAADEPDDTSLAILRAEDEKGMDAGIAKLGKSKTRRTQKEDAGGEDGRGAKINTALHNTPAAEMTDATAGRGEIPVSEMDASTALATGVVANSVETIPRYGDEPHSSESTSGPGVPLSFCDDFCARLPRRHAAVLLCSTACCFSRARFLSSCPVAAAEGSCPRSSL